MNFKYLFPIFVALLALMTSCQEEETVTTLEGLSVSTSYVSLPMEGGSTSITINSDEAWTIEKVTTDKDKFEWVSFSATSGSAGESKLTFTAEETLNGRSGEVLLKTSTKTQRINVIQGLPVTLPATAKEVNSAEDGKTFRITGVCTSIVNTEYGNWYLTDETGSVYIYGTLDKKGGKKNFLSLGIEVGDEVTIEGPKSSYKGDPQMVDVMVINLNKSLIKVDSVENKVLPVDGGEFIAHLTCKGQGVSVDIPEDAKSWLSISSIQSAGTNAVVKFKAAANAGGDRKTTLTFKTTDGKKQYTTETSLEQKGAIVATNIADFNAAPVGDTQYRITAVVTKLVNDKYGNVNLRDYSGEVYVYGIKDYQSGSLKEGDIVTIVGKRAEYKGQIQVSGAVLEDLKPVTPISIADVLTKADDKNVFYMVTGEITEIANESYGNVYLKDGDDTIYVYGCYPGIGATGDARKGLIADKGIKVGDKLTVIGVKATYNDNPQISNGIYFSHESAE